ncbi:MAG: hypothetical protein B6D38_06400 [Anaerolineae bacterium UTCFX1]|nr:MAG: hypothetical protein B6D38_06400 [Anaerolineae bacterium UTCFX1]
MREDINFMSPLVERFFCCKGKNMKVEERLAIQELIAKFSNSFDLKDWDGLQACFTETFRAEYAGQPQTVSAAEYAKSRRKTLERFLLHHLVGNYEINFADENSATCRASMIVWRKAEGDESTSHCVYFFQLTKRNAAWKINAVTQRVLWNEGSSPVGK